jgi:hypothetical protein
VLGISPARADTRAGSRLAVTRALEPRVSRGPALGARSPRPGRSPLLARSSLGSSRASRTTPRSGEARSSCWPSSAGAMGRARRWCGCAARSRSAGQQSTAIRVTRAPESISGRAWIGPRTRAFVSWQIESMPYGSTVYVGVIVETAGLRDRLLLAFGGRWWLRRRLASALSCLSHRIAPSPAFVSGGESARSPVPSHACA